MAVTPAGAEVSNAVATNWKKIWKKNLKPLADRRYYKKSTSDAKYATKAESAAAAAAAQAAATSAANSATDTKLGNYYTKAQADAKYAPAQPLYRGTVMLNDTLTAASQGDAGSISFGATFPSAPTPHYIKLGDPIPAGCSGTAAAPNAAAGNFCFFETESFNTSTNRGICRGGPASCPSTDPFGAGIYAYSAGAGPMEVLGTWAARPSGPVVNPAFVPPLAGAVNTGSPSSGTAASSR